jgi:hypothetical protein
MWMWWATLKLRSRIDSATTGLGKREYQFSAERLAVMMRDLFVRSVTERLPYWSLKLQELVYEPSPCDGLRRTKLATVVDQSDSFVTVDDVDGKASFLQNCTVLPPW